jgi:hypothetical protein
VIDNGHAIGPMEVIMDVLHITNEKHLNKSTNINMFVKKLKMVPKLVLKIVIESKTFSALVLVEFAAG